MVHEMSLSFPPLPENWAEDESSHRALAKLLKVHVAPAGREFEIFAQRRSRGRTLSEDEKEQAELESDDEKEVVSSDFDQFEALDLGEMDPSMWKEQDHYEVMGLQKLRFFATQDHIKKAYKIMVMKHHPDKKPKKKNGMDDDDYFKCLKIAFEWLSDPVKRRTYDSVDPEINDDIPTGVGAKNFFKKFGPIMEVHGRWSEVQPAPSLGDMKSTKAEVEGFYNFYYNMNSWREFSYLDETDTNKAGNRDEKRWMEKKNKAERQRRKKEENQRMNKLIDACFSADPRIKLFKVQEKEEKEAKRLAYLKAKEDEKKALLTAAADRKAAQEKAAADARKAAADKRRLEKELAERKVAAKEKLMELCKTEKYFLDPDTDFDGHLANIRRIAKMADENEADVLEELVANFSEASVMGKVKEAEDAIAAAAAEKERIKAEAEAAAKAAAEAAAEAERIKNLPYQWNEKELDLLVKAVKMFPPGSRNRWWSIWEYITSRCEGSTLIEKDVIERVKKQASQDSKGSDFAKFQSGTKKINVNAVGGLSQNSGAAPWSKAQQKQLEQALKKHKAIPAKEGKFDKVSAEVDGKNKEECIARFKEIAAQVKAKKAAAGSSSKK